MHQLLEVIIDKTWGWVDPDDKTKQKESDMISNSQFRDATTMKKQNVTTELNRAEAMKIINVTEKGYNIAKRYSINTNYGEWIASPKKVTSPISVTGVTQIGSKSSPISGTTIDSLTIDTSTIERTLSEIILISLIVSELDFWINGEATKIATILADGILINDPGEPKLQPSKKETTVLKWADDIEKINRLDGREWPDILRVAEFVQRDDFEKNNVKSGSKMRKRFSQLLGKCGQGKLSVKEPEFVVWEKRRASGVDEREAKESMAYQAYMDKVFSDYLEGKTQEEKKALFGTRKQQFLKDHPSAIKWGEKPLRETIMEIIKSSFFEQTDMMSLGEFRESKNR